MSEGNEHFYVAGDFYLKPCKGNRFTVTKVKTSVKNEIHDLISFVGKHKINIVGISEYYSDRMIAKDIISHLKDAIPDCYFYVHEHDDKNKYSGIIIVVRRQGDKNLFKNVTNVVDYIYNWGKNVDPVNNLFKHEPLPINPVSEKHNEKLYTDLIEKIKTMLSGTDK